MVGRGSVNHNSRKFNAKNTDPERTHLNEVYCNEDIKAVYHELFDEALERYNEKQTRADRRIEDYYDKICSGKQEKPFHEIILQIGNREDMAADSEAGELARETLNEYMQSFQERNPQLRVFSAHLHMDEATPHLHIDFIPYISGSNRGLDTRVSLKKALNAQGFKGGSRGDTEWSQWVQAEKEQLAEIMERHGIEWEQKGTHEKHLSVLDYKKQERTKEVEALENTIEEKQQELSSLTKRVERLDKGKEEIESLEYELEYSPELQLPEAPKLMSAKAYRAELAEPLVVRLKHLVKSVLVRYVKVLDSYERLRLSYTKLSRENSELKTENKYLSKLNSKLKDDVRDYGLLKRLLGKRQIDSLLEQARQGGIKSKDRLR